MCTHPSLRFVPVLSLLAFAVGCQDGERPLTPMQTPPRLSVTSGEGTWTTKASMPTPRWGLAAGVANGILYAVGGNSTQIWATLEAYDPAGDTWTTKASMPTAREDLAAAVVNGTLYAVGGAPPSGQLTAAVEAYNPATNTWTTKAAMPTTRQRLAAGVVNGVLYAVGGDNSSILATVEAYDPATNTWTTKAPMPTARHNLGVGVVNGILYAVGGSNTVGLLTTVEAYDPATNTWTTKASMPTARSQLAVGVVNGIVYAVGGAGLASPNYLATVEAYDPATNTWTTKAPMLNARMSLAAGVVNGILYAVGGFNTNSYTPVAPIEAYQPSTGTLWPNEPAGFVQFNDQPWDSLTGNNWSWLRRGGSTDPDIHADPTAPLTPQNVLRITYDNTLLAGESPSVHWIGLPRVDEIYTAWWVKISDNCPDGGCGKMTFLLPPDSAGGQVFTAFYHPCVYPEFPDQCSPERRGPPYKVGVNTEWWPYVQKAWQANVEATAIWPGTWHRIEFYYRWETAPATRPDTLGSRDGIIRWWVDGRLNGNYTNVAYPVYRGFQEFQFAPTVIEPPPFVQYMYIDHTHVSTPP